MPTMPTLQVLFAPSVVDPNSVGRRMVLASQSTDAGFPVLGTNADPTVDLVGGILGDGATFYDISDDVRSVSTTRGRRRSLDQFGTGTATITLDNRLRQYDPTNLSGPYASSLLGTSGIVPVRPVIIKATWDSVQYTLFRGTIDSWKFDYDKSNNDATATITISDAFKLFENVIGGLPTSTAIYGSTVVGGADIAVTTENDGVVGVETIGSINFTNTVTVNGVSVYPLIGNGYEIAGERINAILDASAWPNELRDIDDGATQLNLQNASLTVLALLREVAAADGGEILIKSDGSVKFADQHHQLTETTAVNVQATFDATINSAKSFFDVSVDYDDTLVANVIRISRKKPNGSTGEPEPEGTTIVVSNAESQSLYGVKYFDLELPIIATNYPEGNTLYGQNRARDLAGFLLSLYSTPELRPSRITLRPQRSPSDLYPDALGLEILNRINVKFNVPGGGELDTDCFIDGISHSILNDSWQTSFELRSAKNYDGFFILDDSNLGKLNTNKLAF